MFTSGRTIYPHMQVPLWYNAAEDLQFIPTELRYRLIVIAEGAGILHYGDCKTLFTAPASASMNWNGSNRSIAPD